MTVLTLFHLYQKTEMSTRHNIIFYQYQPNNDRNSLNAAYITDTQLRYQGLDPTSSLVSHVGVRICRISSPNIVSPVYWMFSVGWVQISLNIFNKYGWVEWNNLKARAILWASTCGTIV